MTSRMQRPRCRYCGHPPRDHVDGHYLLRWPPDPREVLAPKVCELKPRVAELRTFIFDFNMQRSDTWAADAAKAGKRFTAAAREAWDALLETRARGRTVEPSCWRDPRMEPNGLLERRLREAFDCDLLRAYRGMLGGGSKEAEFLCQAEVRLASGKTVFDQSSDLELCAVAFRSMAILAEDGLKTVKEQRERAVAERAGPVGDLPNLALNHMLKAAGYEYKALARIMAIVRITPIRGSKSRRAAGLLQEIRREHAFPDDRSVEQVETSVQIDRELGAYWADALKDRLPRRMLNRRLRHSTVRNPSGGKMAQDSSNSPP
jgi:hypothetical protein